MGQANRKKAKFLAEHPFCCFCGGLEPATTIDHIPSRTYFEARDWPIGYKFPACEPCNKGSSLAEMSIAAITRVTSEYNQEYGLEGVRLLIDAFQNDVNLGKEFLGPIRTSSLMFPRSVTSKLVDESGNQLMNLGKNFHARYEEFVRKLIKALYYKHSGLILPDASKFVLRSITNAQRGKPEAESIEKVILPNTPVLIRSSQNKSRPTMNDQFEYSYLFAENKQVFAFKVRLFQSIMFIVFVSLPGSELPELIPMNTHVTV